MTPTLLALFAATALAALAQQAPAPAPSAAKKSASAAKTNTKAAPKAAEPLAIPKDAVAGADGVYHYTDKSGNKWLYSQTPFGVSRVADMGPVADKGGIAPKAYDLGDTVRFEQPGPFGMIRWEKKKSDLTDNERELLQTQRPIQTSPTQK